VELELGVAEVCGDADRMDQVVTNLLVNAVQYNKDHGQIRVVTRYENHAAVLTVSDTGPGIPAEELPRLFERFYRADKARGRSNGQSGLGLSICKAIVDAHGGSIEVESRVGEGTTFTVRLPA
jgi:signal transduction histidine kinase